MKDNKELRKLIEENPDLPLVFSVPTDYIDDSHCSVVFENSSCYVSEVYFDDEHFSDDKEDIIDRYRDILQDEDEYVYLSCEEFDKVVEDYVDNNVKHYKAIVVNVE